MAISFRTVLLGEGTLLIQCAECLRDRGHEVCGVVSADSTITRWAADQAIPRLAPSDDLTTVLGRTPFDYLFSIANPTLLPASVLALPQRGAINFHDALLPRYAGCHATSWALMNRESEHGISWHEMTVRADAGSILVQHRVSIARDETAFTLNAKCYQAGIAAFAELLDRLADHRYTAQPQVFEKRSYFGKYRRPPAAGVISWDSDANDHEAFVRALTFGPYPNPLGLPKIAVDSDFVVIGEIEVAEERSSLAAGTVTGIGAEWIRIATRTSDAIVRRLSTVEGQPLSMADFRERYGVRTGYRFQPVDSQRAERLTALTRTACVNEEFWIARLSALEPISLPFERPAKSGDRLVDSTPMPLPEHVSRFLEAQALGRRYTLLAAFAAYLARLTDRARFDIGFEHSALRQEIVGEEALFAPVVPLRVEIDGEGDFSSACSAVRIQVEAVRQRGTYARDVFARYPTLARSEHAGPVLSVCASWADTGEESTSSTSLTGGVTLRIPEEDGECQWIFESDALTAAAVATLSRQFITFLEALVTDPTRRIADIPLVSEQEQRLLAEWNNTARPYAHDQCVHELFERQVEQTPDNVAIVFEDREVTYHELNRRANRLARRLRALGVGPEALVGICIERSVEMVVSLLAILKAGGAYVPLDPEYPAERLALMLEDSRPRVLLTQERLIRRLPLNGVATLCIDALQSSLAEQSDDNPRTDVAPDNLAYVNFTSGSTGRPKGVMVTHRNVTNFFSGMDDRIGGGGAPGVWLAVTSISFDISVQELFWPLCRGYKVVVYGAAEHRAARTAQRAAASNAMDFSLSYFASDEDHGADKYRLLRDGARFADEHDFTAVWTPERHFHAFGGLYPNPSVTSALLAGLTKRIQIRAGSVVLPLHSPIRVAEEWSFVDNLSRGRVGISFASGWHATDFVLRPESYADRKALMFRDIETVRALWRGEAVSFKDGTGKDVAVTIRPRPIQAELPIWVTAAGSPDTFRLAGEIGANVLTHLLGQGVDELAKKISLYRDARRASGYPGDGHVTVMLHTFVGESTDTVRDLVRRPFSNYLRSSVDLIRNAASAFPIFSAPTAAAAQDMDAALKAATPDDVEGLVAIAFNRYFETSGLFGSPEDCLAIVDDLRGIGVDEIACLIDFGVDPELVLSSLPRLNTVRERSNADVVVDEGRRYSIAQLIKRHGVSHLQCTPSLARLLLSDDEARESLRSIRTLMLGGEALAPSLLAALADVVSGEIHNMYGPTETTVWSTSCRVTKNAPISIGRPIANTEAFILDSLSRLTPLGIAGELCIGGAGVARGYLNRPDLTDEKFIPHPFSPNGSASRLYKTGDRARYLPDGTIEFLGRTDRQVKVRGFRIELGEIETVLRAHPAVLEAGVIAQENGPGDQRIAAYVVPRKDVPGNVTEKDLRTFMQSKVPDYMVPSTFVTLDELPLTPNGKINRKALPAPAPVRQPAGDVSLAPNDEIEKVIAGAWQEALNVPEIAVDDNFFDLGAHSLLIIQVHAKLKERLQKPVSLIDLFQYPSVRALARHFSTGPANDLRLQNSGARATTRKQRMVHRQELRRTSTKPTEASHDHR